VNLPLRAIARHARATYPQECCGLVLADGDGGLRFVAIDNVAGTAQGAQTSTRSRRDGYVMDPKQLLSALAEVEDSGGRLHAIVHSHPDVGAYFSTEDKQMALGGGDEPLWPGVQYLVVSVRDGVVDGAGLYSWNAVRRDFDEQKMPEIAAEN
jgi:proteasome lid subunit RPN8/RPN11